MNLYTVKEVVNILKVDRRTVYNYINRGSLKALKVGAEWRIPEDNLKAFLGVSNEQ